MYVPSAAACFAWKTYQLKLSYAPAKIKIFCPTVAPLFLSYKQQLICRIIVFVLYLRSVSPQVWLSCTLSPMTTLMWATTPAWGPSATWPPRCWMRRFAQTSLSPTSKPTSGPWAWSSGKSPAGRPLTVRKQHRPLKCRVLAGVLCLPSGASAGNGAWCVSV